MMREGWTYKKLGEVATLLNGFAFQSALFQKAGLPIVRISNIQEDKITSEFVYFNKDDYETDLGKFKVLYGDILIAMSGATTGKVGINYNKEVLYLNQRVGKIVPKENMAHRFLFYYLKTNSTKSLSIAQGVAQPNLSTHQINNFVLPVPPLSEQERIVSELDLLSGIIEKKKAQLKEYDKLAQSIFYDMFGDPVTNEKGWEVKMLGDEFDVSSGGTPSTKNIEYWKDGKISWIGSNMCQNKIIYENDGKYITNEGLEHSSAKLYTKGFVLIALVGATIGKVALLGFETTTNQNIAGVDVPSNKEYKSIFVFYLIQSLYCFFENIGDGKFKMANLSFVRSLPIVKSPLPLQQTFASKIEAIERQKALIKQTITETETLFNSRMDYYFD